MRNHLVIIAIALGQVLSACGNDVSTTDKDSSTSDTGTGSDVAGDTGAPGDVPDALDAPEDSVADGDASPDAPTDTLPADGDVAETADVEPDVPPPPPHFELACDTPPPTGVSAEVVDAWLAEAAARPVGYPASAVLQGLPAMVSGASRVDVGGELRFEVQDRGVDWMFLTGAEVEGLGRGLLAVRLAQGDRHSGRTFTRFEAEGLHTSWARLDPDGNPGVQNRGNFAVLAPLEATPPPQVANANADWDWWYTQAWSLGADSIGAVEMPSFLDIFIAEDGTETLLHEMDVRVTSAEGAWIYVPFGYPIELVPDALAARLEDSPAFGIAGDFVDGSVAVDALGYDARPTAFFGRGGALTVSAEGALASQSEFQLTQAIDAAGLLVPAALELAPTELQVDVEQGGHRVIQVHYREASFEGDAVLGEVQIESDGPEELLKVPVVPFENRTTRLFDFMADAGWGAPALFVPVIVAAPFVFFADVLDCLFFGNCGSGGSVRIEPMLAWVDAGSVHMFEVYVAGAGEPGAHYQVTLTYVGKNYCPASLTLSIDVHASCDTTMGVEPCLCPEGKTNDGAACVETPEP